MAVKTVETRWSVAEIQEAIVRHTCNEQSIPNVSFGFFRGMECDLVQVSGSNYIHEFEIKRAWSDFLADFRKRHFHDDIRIVRLTFVLPEAFAGDRLKKFCEKNYQKFKREFDFLFYAEGGDYCQMVDSHWVRIDDCRLSKLPLEQFRTETYITKEMLGIIRKNDKAAPYRRHLFVEELARLYRLGVIRLWHRQSEKPKEEDNGDRLHDGDGEEEMPADRQVPGPAV